jgi:hypothetical protein
MVLVPASWFLISAAKDVYIAMENVEYRQVSSGRRRSLAARAPKVPIFQMGDDFP